MRSLSWNQRLRKQLFLSAFALVLALIAAPLPAGEHYAFLVAVRQYDKAELTTLQYTEKDITDLAEVLKKSGYGKDNLVLMTQTVGANETRYLPLAKNIREQFELLLSELKSDDTPRLSPSRTCFG